MDKRQRQELGQYLRKRRACLEPRDFGFQTDLRRRVPGLRREEVASLAGISLDWYTWLEQARDIQPSRATVENVANALRLEPLETKYILSLSGFSHEYNDPSNPFIEPSLCAIMDELHDCPCVVVGRRWDILAWNAAAELIYGALDRCSDFERNGLVQYFIGDVFPQTLTERPARAAKAAAIFRMENSRFLGDPFFAQLTDWLAANSSEFCRYWEGHDLAVCDPDYARFDHHELGHLAFEHSAYDLNDSLQRGYRMVTYVPLDDTATRNKIRERVQTNSVTLKKMPIT